MNARTIILVFISIALAIAAVTQCSRRDETLIVHDRIVHDTVHIPSTHIEADSNHTTFHIIEQRLYNPFTLDTALLARVIKQRDSLRGLLASMQVSETLVLDTITDRGDSINVVCNETLRSILLSVRPKPLVRDIIIRDTSIVEYRNMGWALTITAGAGVGTDFRIGPVVAIGISRTIIPLTFLGN